MKRVTGTVIAGREGCWTPVKRQKNMVGIFIFSPNDLPRTERRKNKGDEREVAIIAV
jgi:hypothetical protein